MCHKLLIVLCIQIMSITAAPFQMQLLHPLKQPRQAQPQVIMHTLQQPIPIETYQPHTKIQTPQPLPLRLKMEQATMLAEIQQQMTEEMQQVVLQQQMLALQQLQALQELNTVHAPSSMFLPQPILILLPDEKVNHNDHTELTKNTNENNLNGNEVKNDNVYDNEDQDSIVIEAQDHEGGNGMRKAILLLPTSRFSIGGIISGIPWLPIEVNVPDTVAWAWNGISSGIAGIISIIGNRLPFRPNSPETAAVEPSVKMFLKQLQMKNYNPMMPIYVLPAEEMVPVHFNV
ncbi:uncharacterized protein LOC126366710 [Pectinophora gossypiella]|uniref:uncharacterized protein LOC126366710 n=1 Tax=Pectinophora gossypiella TaxID=13191 RepID=UPI00214E081D|nr:uncharacterized protein LOC126366710 [Pectinophora gossypiella]